MSEKIEATNVAINYSNDNGKFVDVSEQAGIFGGANGYGLGLAISDFYLDGYPDDYLWSVFRGYYAQAMEWTLIFDTRCSS
jgi:hypothetical protein